MSTPALTPDEAFRAYQAAVDNREAPESIAQYWAAYWRTVEAEMREKREAA